MSIAIVATDEIRFAAGISGTQLKNVGASNQRPASSFLRWRKAPMVTRDRISTIVEESIGSVCRIPEGGCPRAASLPIRYRSYVVTMILGRDSGLVELMQPESCPGSTAFEAIRQHGERNRTNEFESVHETAAVRSTAIGF